MLTVPHLDREFDYLVSAEQSDDAQPGVRVRVRFHGRLVDASEFLGTGITPTFPANTWYPAVVAIDRILTRGATPLSFERVELPGSDHYGVIGDVLLAESADH